MHTPEDSTAERLLAHAASLRALARHLLADPHAAEDALQDTWVVALERPPAHADGLGAWLRTVMRSVVSNRRRAETRRSGHERVVARSEAQDAGDERAHALRTVVDAVLALEDPYRRTIVARYFEGLMPREIARREQVPVHTVESRLQRALGQLRNRLERDHTVRRSGMRGALMLIASAPAPSTGSALVAGSKAKVIAACVAVLLTAGLAWLTWGRAGQPEVATRPAEEELASVASASTRTSIPGESVDTPPAAVLAASSPARENVPPPPSHEVSLKVRVTSTEGAPVLGAAVLASPRRHSLNDVATTDADGLAEVLLRTTTDRVDLVVAAWHPELGLSGPWRIATRDGVTTQIDLALVEGALPDLDAQAKIGQHALDDHDAAAKPGLRTLRSILQAPAAGRTQDGVQLVRAAFQSLARAQRLWSSKGGAGGRGFGSSYSGTLLGLGRESEMHGLLRMGILKSGSRAGSVARVAGRVLDRAGQPVEHALVLAGPEDDPCAQQTRTDALGRYELEVEASGVLRLLALAPCAGEARQTLVPLRDQTLRWDARLDGGLTYAGRLEAQDGTAQPGITLEWAVIEAGRLTVRSALANASARFCFAQLPDEHAVLLARISGDDRLPCVVSDEVEPWPTEQLHRTPSGPGDAAGVRIRFLDEDRDSQSEFLRIHAGFEARVWTNWKRGVERCVWMDLDAKPGAFQASDLPPGSYTLEVGSEFDGWFEMGPFDVMSGAVLDLGTVALPETGFVKATQRVGSGGGRWLVRRGVVETVIDALERDRSETAHRLPPGDYVYFHPNDRAGGVAFTLRGGESVVVDEAGASVR